MAKPKPKTKKVRFRSQTINKADLDMLFEKASRGASKAILANILGIDRTTLQRWTAKGEERLSEIANQGCSEIDEVFQRVYMAIEGGLCSAEMDAITGLLDPDTKNFAGRIFWLQKIRQADWTEKADALKQDNNINLNITTVSDATQLANKTSKSS